MKRPIAGGLTPERAAWSVSLGGHQVAREVGGQRGARSAARRSPAVAGGGYLEWDLTDLVTRWRANLTGQAVRAIAQVTPR